MHRTLCRLGVLKNHLCAGAKLCSSSNLHNVGCPSISINPVVGMVDEIVSIQLHGLEAKQNVTLVASLKENGMKFESRCVYETDENGSADNYTSTSTAGTFTGVEPMGLFWSLKSNPPSRLIKKDVGSPVTISIQVYRGSIAEARETDKPVMETQIQRLYKKPGVKRIPLEGRFKGTVFVPEGEGPFPALVDMYGGLVSLIETRAALVASHGYVTMALSYIHESGMIAAELDYIQDAYKWLMEQEYVDKNRLGAIGLCYGGTLCLHLAALIPQIRTVVNVNGIEIGMSVNPDGNATDEIWPNQDRVFHTEEGFDISAVFDCDYPILIPAWQNGAKILIICGEDDKQVHPKWHPYFLEHCPDEYKSSMQMHSYPGAGHMIEPPYTPHIRSIVPGKKRMSSLPFVPEKYYDKPMMTGGWTTTHAHAQEDSWKKILDFLEQNLKS